jgi:hypothetical protein
MATEENKTEFDELCDKYSTWIIEYKSFTFDRPLFLIWATEMDEYELNGFLVDKTEQVVGCQSLQTSIETITNKLNDLEEFDQLSDWLSAVEGLKPTVKYKYDIDNLYESVKANTLTVDVLDELTDFINLFDDLARQLDDNEYLLNCRYNKPLVKVWEYYYDNIFWPTFGDEEKIKELTPPPFVTDPILLLVAFNQLRDAFEDKISVL